MSEQFKLIKQEHSQVHQEWQWTYELAINFNGCSIKAITITDHYQQKTGREHITNELILNIFQQRLDKQEMKPQQRVNNREIYVWEWVPYQGKTYHLIFWFKDHTDNHLWVRNCYQIS